jgi:hypothetical protein
MRKDHPEYEVWKNMRRRCNDPRNKRYARYGGRGITICARWDDFLLFIEDMGPKPSPKHTLERIDNDGPYCPTNCRWATGKEQARNRRTNRLVAFNGRTCTLAEWAEIAGIPYPVLRARFYRLKWPIVRCLSEPHRKSKKLSRSEASAIQNDTRTMAAISDSYSIGLTTVWKIKHGISVRTTS